MDSGIKVGDKISVKFLGQDTNGRYLISRRALLPPPADRQQPNSNRPRHPRSTSHTPHTAPKFEIGSELEVTIIDELNSGFLVELAPGVTSLLHNSRINHSYVCVLCGSIWYKTLRNIRQVLVILYHLMGWDAITIVSQASIHCRISAHVPNFKGLMLQLPYKRMQFIYWVSTHAGCNRELCLSAHGRLTGSLQ